MSGCLSEDLLAPCLLPPCFNHHSVRLSRLPPGCELGWRTSEAIGAGLQRSQTLLTLVLTEDLGPGPQRRYGSVTSAGGAGVGIGLRGANAIRKGLRDNCTLRKLRLYNNDLGVGAAGIAAAARRCTSLTKVDLACNRLSPAVGRHVLATLQGVAASRASFALELRQLAVHGAGRMSAWEFLSKRRTRLYFGRREGAAMSRSEREQWDELVPESDPDYEPPAS